MGLFDRFKTPKWKNEDPQVRIEGIVELSKDFKNMKKNQEILDDLLQNDPDQDVRIAAIRYINSDVAIKDAALSDPDWRVRKAAVEDIKTFLDNTIKHLPDSHYETNRPLVVFLENVSKNDSNEEVRKAAKKLADNPDYNKKVLMKKYGNVPKKINYTVVDAGRNTEKSVVLKLNEKFEYVCEADSVEELFDCCFGGDIITVTYDNLSGINKENYMVVDYNILDSHVPNPNRKAIEGTDFNRIVSYENVNSQNFTNTAFPSANDKIYNALMIPIVQYSIHTEDRMFLVKKDDEINFKGMDFERTVYEDGIPDLSKAKSNLTNDQRIKHFKFKVKKIEFVCRKLNQMPTSENMTVYRQ